MLTAYATDQIWLQIWYPYRRIIRIGASCASARLPDQCVSPASHRSHRSPVATLPFAASSRSKSRLARCIAPARTPSRNILRPVQYQDLTYSAKTLNPSHLNVFPVALPFQIPLRFSFSCLPAPLPTFSLRI